MSLLDSMVKIRRANVILRIPREEAQRYLQQGYEVIDESGEVLEHSTAMDLNSLKIAYNSALKEIDELKEKIARLEAEKQSQVIEAVEEEESRHEETEEEVLEKPTKKAVRKTSKK